MRQDSDCLRRNIFDKAMPVVEISYMLGLLLHPHGSEVIDIISTVGVWVLWALACCGLPGLLFYLSILVRRTFFGAEREVRQRNIAG